MNEKMEGFCRAQIKKDLLILTQGQVDLFKRMYSPKFLGIAVDEVVDSIPVDRLDWAMQQVTRTLINNLEESNGKSA